MVIHPTLFVFLRIYPFQFGSFVLPYELWEVFFFLFLSFCEQYHRDIVRVTRSYLTWLKAHSVGGNSSFQCEFSQLSMAAELIDLSGEYTTARINLVSNCSLTICFYNQIAVATNKLHYWADGGAYWESLVLKM